MLTYCDVIDARAGRQQLWRHNDQLFPCGCYGRWFNKFVRQVCAKFFNIMEKICEAVKCLASWLTGKGQCARHEIMVKNIVPIFTSFGIENSSQHSGRPRTFLALISLLKLFLILFCDPPVSNNEENTPSLSKNVWRRVFDFEKNVWKTSAIFDKMFDVSQNTLVESV